MRGIGEMARASGLSVSALRFHDGAGVLVPAEVDPATGYRRYADHQIRSARLVAGLRRVGMPVAEIARAMHNPSCVREILEHHRRRLATGYADAQRELSRIQAMLDLEERLMTRVTLTAFPGIVTQWQQIVVFVAIASMALGSFAAIGQKNIKRLMAYSSIGHMGFALVGLAAGTVEGAQGVLIYIAIYVAMTLGSFAIILAMKRNGQNVEDISAFAGLSRTNPLLAFVFAMLLFSLAGIPPLAGFFAKWYVFVAAIKAGLFTLAVVGVLTSVVGAYYYLAIIKVMYFDEPLVRLDPIRMELRTVLAVAGIFNIFFFVYPAPLVSVATVAAKSLF